VSWFLGVVDGGLAQEGLVMDLGHCFQLSMFMPLHTFSM
jgi:hypothetical protein